MLANPWRLLPMHIGSSSLHVALSDALVRHVTEPALWWHATDRPTLVLGSGQQKPEIDAWRLEDARMLVVRRHAGGTAVYATPDVLGLDIALPYGHDLASPDVVEAYRWLGELWNSVCLALGAGSRVVGIRQARDNAAAANRLPISLACFGTLSPYEVVVGDRKLVGFAQVRRRHGMLLQTGIHLRFEAGPLAAMLVSTGQQELAGELEGAAIGLGEAVGRPMDMKTIIDTFEAQLARRYAISLVPSAWTSAEFEHARVVEPEAIDMESL